MFLLVFFHAYKKLEYFSNQLIATKYLSMKLQIDLFYIFAKVPLCGKHKINLISNEPFASVNVSSTGD